MTPDRVPSFQPMPGIYEPSAVQQLSDGRFLVAEDEKDHPLSLVTIRSDGSVNSTAIRPGLLQIFSEFWQLADLEGLAMDRAGYVYAITSHSRDGDGDSKMDRDKLVRFRIDGDALVDRKLVHGLKRVMTAAHPVLAAAAMVKDVKTDGGLNIEALEMSPDQQRLMIGFRSPLQNGCAIIASLVNPAAIFESGEVPKMSAQLDLLDLGGNGIRGLAYIPSLNGYLVIGGPASRAQRRVDLWFWSGASGSAARRVTVAGLPGFERAEGVSPAVMDGKQCIVIVSDDGNRKKGISAHYLLLDPAQLRIAH